MYACLHLNYKYLYVRVCFKLSFQDIQKIEKSICLLVTNVKEFLIWDTRSL